LKVMWRRCGLAAELTAQSTAPNKLHADWDI
jgi:hypothetical protein